MWVKNDLSVFHVSFIFNHNRFHFHCKDQVLQMKQIQCTKQKQSHLINYNSYLPHSQFPLHGSADWEGEGSQVMW